METVMQMFKRTITDAIRELELAKIYLDDGASRTAFDKIEGACRALQEILPPAEHKERG